MDLFLLHSIVDELNPLVSGHRPGRVWQLGLTDLLIDFNLRDGRWLRLMTDPLRLGFYLTSRGPRHYAVAPRNDTPFVALWHKYLDGSRLMRIEPLGYDRIVHFIFTTAEGAERRLVVSLTGRAANLLLLAGRQVLAELREREEPLEVYVDPPPARDRLDPLSCRADDLMKITKGQIGEVGAAAQNHLLGFTPLLSRELAARVEQSASLETGWAAMIADLAARPGQPTIYANPSLDQLIETPGCDEMTLFLSSIPLHHLPARLQIHPPSLNEAAEQYFNLLEARRQVTSLRQRLTSHIQTRLKRLNSLLSNLDREEERYGEAETWQRYGDLLLTNAHEAARTDEGMWLVVDYFDPEQRLIEIATADLGSAQESAEYYFRLARKGRHSRQSIAARRPPVIAEIAQLRSDQARLPLLTRLSELEEMARQLGLTAERGDRSDRIKGSGAINNRQVAEIAVPGTRRYRSSDGYEILVGRTDRDNDHLTLRIAKSSDLWFHAADYPGSHVILRNPKRQEIPQRSIIEAAQLAAKFSQAKDLPKAAVNYCEKKFVSKPKGFAPGQVRLASFRTVLVEPAEAGVRN